MSLWVNLSYFYMLQIHLCVLKHTHLQWPDSSHIWAVSTGATIPLITATLLPATHTHIHAHAHTHRHTHTYTSHTHTHTSHTHTYITHTHTQAHRNTHIYTHTPVGQIKTDWAGAPNRILATRVLPGKAAAGSSSGVCVCVLSQSLCNFSMMNHQFFH